MAVKTVPASRVTAYTIFLLLVAGFGGLLYGIDVGIISDALLYLSKTISLTVSQTSVIVAAVFGGSMVSSLIAGFLADLLGRKKMMVASGLMFVASIVLVVLSQGFVPLFLGRLLQGLSGGVIAVVVPLYLAECLPAGMRGRGSAIFQFMLTFGIVLAALIGWYYIRGAEAAIAAAGADVAKVRAAEDHAWRGMFLAVLYPGGLFFAGTFLLSETPRWLFRRGKIEQARAALLRSNSEEEATREIAAMQELRTQTQVDEARGGFRTLLERKYVVPFALACVILACNQATGINSVLGYLALILKQAGMSATHATQGDVVVKVLNCVMTVVAVALIDRKGRKFLLTLGTGGVLTALLLAAFFLHRSETQRVDVLPQVEALVHGNRLTMTPAQVAGMARAADGRSATLTMVYSYGSGSQVATLGSEENGTLAVAPGSEKPDAQLAIARAFVSPQPPESNGWVVTLCLALFIASFAIGPGVVVWLTLSELMPTRIRSSGMGIALLLNQGVSTLIAGMFLPVATNYGYGAMFAGWAACTLVYFLVAVFFLPETKGKTLEEIERGFAMGKRT